MTRTTDALDRFIDGSIYALLEIDTGSTENPEAADYCERIYAHQWQTPGAHWERDALADGTRERLEREATEFFTCNIRDLVRHQRALNGLWDDWHSVGMDFHLTRNHHGAGYWDRGTGDVGRRLTDNAHPYGEIHGWILDDDLVVAE